MQVYLSGADERTPLTGTPAVGAFNPPPALQLPFEGGAVGPYQQATTGAARYSPPVPAGPYQGASYQSNVGTRFSPEQGGSDDRQTSSVEGYVQCCGCAGSGSWSRIDFSPEAVSFHREERGSCNGPCCASCSMSEDESVLLDRVEMASAHIDAEPYLFAVGLTFLFSFLGSPLGVLLLWASIACCPRTRLSLTTSGDSRPSEFGSRAVLHAPIGRFAEMWDLFKRSFSANRATASLDSTLVPDSSHALSVFSRLDISSTRIITAQENYCCKKSTKDVITHAADVKWVKLPHPSILRCDFCCSKGSALSIGTHESFESVRMDGIMSSRLVPHLRNALLEREPHSGEMSASYATDECCTCTESSKIQIDPDFTTITQPGSLTLFRTSEIPFVYKHKSAIQCCAAIRTLIFIGSALAAYIFALILGPCYTYQTYVGYPYSGYKYVEVCHTGLRVLIGFLLPLGIVLFSLALSWCGVVSLTSLASCCCRVSGVTLGTPGAASSYLAAGCCGRKTANKQHFLRVNDNGSTTDVFAQNALTIIRQARALDVASRTGASKHA